MTIYALSSGSGVSGIAVIRISGENTSNLLKLLTKDGIPKPRVATLKKINNIKTSELIDQGIILWFPGPESYTGEDMAEIHVHGGKAVVQSMLDNLSMLKDCRLAEPGEFTKLAFQNGKIDLLKAESISDLISAETEIQRLQALKVMQGSFSKTFNVLREKLLKILSFVEAKIDFPDEDLPENILDNIKTDVQDIIKELEKITNSFILKENIQNLIDQNETNFSLEHQNTSLSLLYFGYSYCPDICPYDLERNAYVKDIMDEQQLDINLVFITNT